MFGCCRGRTNVCKEKAKRKERQEQAIKARIERETKISPEHFEEFQVAQLDAALALQSGKRAACKDRGNLEGTVLEVPRTQF